MNVGSHYNQDKKVFSFEFFPPKTPQGEESLFATVDELKSLNPDFISVTYGAMGTTRENTLRIVSKIQNEVGIDAAAHLTCVGHTKEEIESILHTLKENNIQNIVALRGDPPKDAEKFEPVEGGFAYASELVSFIRNHNDFKDYFGLAVAGYPEGHLECSDKQKDLENLKHKVDQGADIVITQLFFDNADYFDFVDKARSAGISIPIVPGIMPVTQPGQLKRFSEMCGSKITNKLREGVEKCGEGVEATQQYGIEYATEQCERLLKGGAPGLHFYTLNKSRATFEIHKNLHLNGA